MNYYESNHKTNKQNQTVKSEAGNGTNLHIKTSNHASNTQPKSAFIIKTQNQTIPGAPGVEAIWYVPN